MALREPVSSIPDTGSKKDYIVLLVPFEKLCSHISLKQTKKKLIFISSHLAFAILPALYTT